MYVCLCNGLTDQQIRQVAQAQAALGQPLDRPAQLYAACRCRAQCGTCTRTICDMLRNVADEHLLAAQRPAANQSAPLQATAAVAMA